MYTPSIKVIVTDSLLTNRVRNAKTSGKSNSFNITKFFQVSYSLFWDWMDYLILTEGWKGTNTKNDTKGVVGRVVQGEVGSQKWVRKKQLYSQVEKEVKYAYVSSKSNYFRIREESNSISGKCSVS